MEKKNKLKKTQTLHVIDETINSIPLQKPMEEADILHHTLLEERPLSHVLEQGGMEIPFSKQDPIIGGLPIHVVEVEGNNVVTYRDYLVLHAEEGGALAPTRWVLVSLQGIPQDIFCGDQGTTYDQHVNLLRDCKTMQMEGGDREDD